MLNGIKRAVELYQRKPNYSDKNKGIINNSNNVNISLIIDTN